jgi:hypothetical protein
MTSRTAPYDTDFQTRWKQWQAKGVEGDRRRTAILRGISAVSVAGLLVWLWALLG